MTTGRKETMEKMQQELDADVADTRGEFDRAHADVLQKLRGLSEEDLKEVLPNVSDRAVYDKLIAVVQDASAKNLSNAELVERIQALGSVAVAIAKKAGVILGMA